MRSQVRGRELYKIVMTIVRNYEISRRYEELAPLFKQMKEFHALPGERNIPILHHLNEASIPGGGPLSNLPTQLLPGLGEDAGLGNGRASPNGSTHHPPSSTSSPPPRSPTPPIASLLQGGEGNGFPSASRLRSLLPEALAPESSVYDWLSGLELEGLAGKFASRGLATMADLEPVLSMELLEEVGVPDEERDRLYGAFIQYSALRQRQLSALSLASSANASTVPPSFSLPIPYSEGWCLRAAGAQRASALPRPRSRPPTACPPSDGPPS